MKAKFYLPTNNISAKFGMNVTPDIRIFATKAELQIETDNRISGDNQLCNRINLVEEDILDLSVTVNNNYAVLDNKFTSIYETITNYGDIVSYDAAEFATANQGLLADTALQPNDNITLLNNNAGYITNADLEGYATEEDLEYYQSKEVVDKGIMFDPAHFDYNVDSFQWTACTYGAGRFVAIGLNGYTTTSTDFANWEPATENANLGRQRNWSYVIYDGTKFIALGGAGYISTSTDGINWTQAVYVSNLGNRYWSVLLYDGNKYFALSDSGYISTSTDGTTWTQAVYVSNLGQDNVWTSLAYDGNIYVALSYYGFVSTSTDGINWTQAIQHDELSDHWTALIYDGTQFIGLGRNGNIATSEDGVNWIMEYIDNLGFHSWYSIVLVNNIIYLLSSTGYISQSSVNTVLNNIEGDNLFVGFTNGAEYKLINATTGLIPDERISTNIARSIDIPHDTNDLTNSAGFITNTVNNLTNYYKKSESYTKLEVQQLINSDLATALADYTPSSNLATVATTGDYDDLLNKPTIPTKTSDLTNDSGYIKSATLNTLTDVSLDNLSNGQGLIYNSTAEKWENATIGGGSTTVDQTYDPTSANAQSGVAINGAGFLTNNDIVSRSVTSSSLLFSTASTNGYIETIQTYTFADLYKVDCIHKCGNIGSNYYTSVKSPFLTIYKDADNYFGIERQGYNLRLINVVNGTAVNTEEWTGGINSINTYFNLYLSLNFVNKKMAIIGSNNSGTITTLFTFDFSTWNITLDVFKIRISGGKYSGNQYNVYLRTNDCYNYEEILNYKFQINNYNSLPVLADGDKCSLPTTLYIDGTVTSTISDTHKISNATISSLNYFMISSGHDDYLTDYFVTSLVKFRITSGSAQIHAGVGISSFILMDENFTLLYNSASTSENYTLTNNTWYYLYVKGVGNQQWNYTRRYGAKFEGTFTIEAIAEFIGYPRSINLCAETFDGKYFSGAIPMTSDKTSFEEVTFTKSMNGFHVPIGAIVTDTTSISMYNGTSWIDTKSFVVNKATGTDSLTIFGTAATAANAINIGATSSMAGGSYSVGIGYGAKCNSSNAIAIGRGASVGSNARDVSAIGYNARVANNANYAIQLGNGQNSTANTLSVGFNNTNYQLLDGTTGLIPDARISTSFAKMADLATNVSTNQLTIGNTTLSEAQLQALLNLI